MDTSYSNTVPYIRIREPPHSLEEDISEHANPLSYPLLSREQANKQSLAFGRAAFTFRDSLMSIRDKRASAQTSVGSPNSVSAVGGCDVNEDTQMEAKEKSQKPIRIIRGVQGLLTAILSIFIAIFQGKVYLRYLETKDRPNAWPNHPSLVPTLMLFAIAIMAFTFDLFLIVAYVSPNKGIAGKAYELANKMHHILTATKTVSYVIVAIICRSGYNFGNSSGTNFDLWSWTCSNKSDQQSAFIQAQWSCSSQVSHWLHWKYLCSKLRHDLDTQTMAWMFSLIVIAIEVLGALITILLAKRNTLTDTVAYSQITSTKDKNEQLDSIYTDVESTLADLTPQIDHA
jgi:hypothetical protein